MTIVLLWWVVLSVVVSPVVGAMLAASGRPYERDVTPLWKAPWQPKPRRVGLPPVSRARRAQAPVYQALREAVRDRAGGWCQIGSDVCQQVGSQCHHVLQRSAGGKDILADCVWVCLACHDWLHAHPTQAYERGWLRRAEPTPDARGER